MPSRICATSATSAASTRVPDGSTPPRTPVFTHAEDERLAAALLSVVRRPDFDPATLDSWLERFAVLEERVWQQSPPEAKSLDAAQNARNLLRSLHLLLAMPQPDPTPGQRAARENPLRQRHAPVL